ncbi:MAG: response regulator [Deltaproteobacteria bacterium]|nr:response regulator [Deltaproteobacteria bacterium]
MARRKHSVDGPVYYTTYQVAKFFGVSLPTVVNWVNSGLLSAHRTPGGHRRLARNDVIAFARQHEYPLAKELLGTGDGKKKILVVDDEQDFSEMVREYLSMKEDFEVEVADSGFQAGFTVARFKPDLILMDLMMPDMDGFEVHRMLRDDVDTRHIPVIACTAYRDPVVDARVREERFDGFMEKPLKLDSLLTVIRKHLGMEQEAEDGEGKPS